MSAYPEHDKLSAVVDKSQAIGEFLEWLSTDQGMVIAEFDEVYDHYTPVHRSHSDWLARYFQIDQVQIEREKRAMLDGMRALHDDEVAS